MHVDLASRNAKNFLIVTRKFLVFRFNGNILSLYLTIKRQIMRVTLLFDTSTLILCHFPVSISRVVQNLFYSIFLWMLKFSIREFEGQNGGFGDSDRHIHLGKIQIKSTFLVASFDL